MSGGVEFAGRVRGWQTRVEQALAQRLPPSDAEPTRLHAAMRYCVLDSGERLHPLLLFGTASALGLAEAEVEAAACALELIHAYSLVHDDLPALEDDEERGGRPACHKAYDAGTAVLVGDALQSLAFQVLAGDAALPAPAQVRLRMIALLAEAIGAGGLTGGQSLDVEARGRQLSESDLEAVHARRSGSLIRASVLMAAECAPPGGPGLQQSLSEFASALALAVPPRRDGRAAAALCAGPEASRQRLAGAQARALGALHALGPAAEPLRELARWLVRASPEAMPG